MHAPKMALSLPQWSRAFAVTAVALVALAFVFPQGFAVAQASLEARVGKLEAEMRAVQRKVFPGGNERFFEPEISTSVSNPVSTPATGNGGLTPEMLSRLDSLESSVTRLNARIEEQDGELAAMEKRLATLEGTASPAAPVEPTPVAKPTEKPVDPSAKPDPARVAAVAKIERPATGDGFEDGYNYGYRLWEAKFYPEAQIALKQTADKYPKHARASYARNLLGRSYLDDGKPRMSADIFLDNYQTDPRGERAPDSLLYLSVALTRLNEKDKACIVLTELTDVYPTSVTGRLSRQYADAKAKAGCK